MQCDWFLKGTFYFKAGYKFKGSFGWSEQKDEDLENNVELPLKNQIKYNGYFVDDWEIEIQNKRVDRINKTNKKLFQTNDLRGISKKCDSKYLFLNFLIERKRI